MKSKTTNLLLFIRLSFLIWLLATAQAFAAPASEQQNNSTTYQQEVTGTVTDANTGESMPGVSIAVKGTSLGTITDINGKFSLKVTDENSILKFSFIGYIPQEVAVKGRSIINVTLEQDAASLEGVVVVGYGVQKKSDVTGSVVSVNMEKLAERPSTNIVQALQGSMAGLSVSVNGSSADGTSTSMLIRGQNSITASNSPLIILDGVPFNGSMNEINPNDIESLEVLKDASSAAIYGARGSNGVILITTKIGKKGKPKVSYDTYYGLDQISYIPTLMDGSTFYMRKAEYGESFTNIEQTNYDAGKYTNWIEEATRTGIKSQHNLSVSGANDVTRYFVSGSLNNVKGIAKNDDFKRYTLRLNLDIQLAKWAKFGTNTSLGYYDRSGVQADFYDAFRMNPLGNAYNEDGTIAMLTWEDPFYAINPLNALNYINSDKTKSINTNNYLQIDFPFIKGLSYKLNTGYEYRTWITQTYAGRNTYEGSQSNGKLELSSQFDENWLVENILSYNNTFGKHSVFLTGLYSAQNEKREINTTQGLDFPSDVLTYYQPDKAKTTQSNAVYRESSHLSQMFRANYSYDSRYLFTFTVRHDGYSAFGDGTKYGTFPSFAVGWNITNESFIKSLPKLEFVNILKLRLSYGSNGNEAISPYSTLPSLSSLDYLTPDFKPAFGFYPQKLGNPLLGWETTKSFNTGLDFGLWNNRVSGLFEMYWSTTTDLLLDKTISPINGDTYIRENIGETKNNGIEFQVSTVNISKTNFTWKTDLNISHNQTKIVNVGLTDENGNYIDDIASEWFIGQPIKVNYDYVYDGVWQTGDDIANSAQPTAMPGYIKYKDVNGDSLITTADKQIIGSRDPFIVLGMTNTFTYKNFRLSFLINAVQGITYRNLLYGTGQVSFRVNSYDKNFWSPTNPTNEYPANVDGNVNPLSMNFYEDASFIRLQDITFGYRLPENLIKKIFISNAEIFINLKNMATWTKWTGLDPEYLSILPINQQRAAPQIKSYIVGAKFSF
ncbi:MAG: TonB-dependent receptor [Bacteroidales bacterium]|nr:TonB-dependent receptor [Bacteroidales bacterium]